MQSVSVGPCALRLCVRLVGVDEQAALGRQAAAFT